MGCQSRRAQRISEIGVGAPRSARVDLQVRKIF